MSDSRVVKPKLPLRVIVSAALIGVLVLGFVAFAIGYSAYQVEKSKMPGVIVSKEFISDPAREITIGRRGDLSARDKEGDYYLKVDVVSSNGEKKSYDVLVPKMMYDKLKVGDPLDIGPYLVKE